MATHHPIVVGVCFKDIAGFPGYAVGDDGSVWSCRVSCPGGRIGDQWHQLKPQLRRGYYRVGLWRDGKLHWKSVAHIVLEAFVGPRPPGMECCHAPDLDRTNNHSGNLRWDTQAGNIADSIHRFVRGSQSKHAKLEDADIPEVRRLVEQGLSEVAL